MSSEVANCVPSEAREGRVKEFQLIDPSVTGWDNGPETKVSHRRAITGHWVLLDLIYRFSEDMGSVPGS